MITLIPVAAFWIGALLVWLFCILSTRVLRRQWKSLGPLLRRKKKVPPESLQLFATLWVKTEEGKGCHPDVCLSLPRKELRRRCRIVRDKLKEEAKPYRRESRKFLFVILVVTFVFIAGLISVARGR